MSVAAPVREKQGLGRFKERVAKLRFLVVGLGSAGRRHADNLVALGARKLEALTLKSGRSSYEAAGRPVVLHREYAAALKARPDAVVIANPSALHAEYAAPALENGCSVFLEKPAAVSAAQARSLLDRAAGSDAVVAVGCQHRFNPCLEKARSLLAEGRLGPLLAAQACMGEYLPDYHPGEDYRQGYAARRALGGGVLLTQIHDLNYLSWLFGPFDSVYAVGGKTSSLEIDVEDRVSFLLRSREGLGIAAHVDYLQRRKARTLSIIGQDGSLFWDCHANRLLLRGKAGDKDLSPKAPLDRNRMFIDALADFLRCVFEGGSPRTGLADAAADLEAVDAIRESLSRGKAVAIAHA